MKYNRMYPLYISSRTHPLVQQTVSLHHAEGRAQTGLFIAEGLRTFCTVLQSGIPLKYLFVTQERYSDCAHLVPAEQIIQIHPSVADKVSSLSTAPGIIGIFVIPSSPSNLDLTQNTATKAVVLARVSDPGNAGTLIRTAAALGLQTALFVEGVDPWSPKVVQASAGTIAQIMVIRCTWAALVAYCTAHTVPLAALVVEGGVDIRSLTHKPALFIIGNEAHGIPAEWLADCQMRITIPMPGNTESLNAAVAGSLALYIPYLLQNATA